MTATFPPVLLSVENLVVSYAEPDGRREVVHGASFTVSPGEVVALVGESGSGKTTIAQAIIGLLPDNGHIDAGVIRLGEIDIAGWSEARLRNVRGTVVSLVPQDPVTSLNPVKTIGEQVGEIFRIHGERDRRGAAAAAIDLLARVGLDDPALRARQYPHELSGGMRQRVLIAIAVALRPQLIIADEPTSALDVTVQARILDLIDELRREYGTAVLFVTHDLGVAADRSDRVVVLKSGHVEEAGITHEVLAKPAAAYTARLLADAPSLHPPARPPRRIEAAGEPIVVVEDLVQDFPVAGGDRRFLRAVDRVSFAVAPGTTHALVGESGSGKTTTIRTLVGFQRPTSGRILIDGVDVARTRGEDLRRLRRSIQLVHQNPFASLDPRQTVFDIVEEPLLNFEPVAKAERRARVAAILDRVHLPADLAGRRPRALSGGQRQRVAIARALILEPKVVVLDEAVSALDVTVQARILELLDELQRDLGLTYVFVSHDLAVVRRIADTVSVLHRGRVVEAGPVEEVFASPGDPYTRDLVAAIPGRGRAARRSPTQEQAS